MVIKGQLSQEDYSLTCIACGSQENVTLAPHRANGKVTGIFCFCENCFPKFANATLRTEWVRDCGEVAPKEQVEALIASTNSAMDVISLAELARINHSSLS